MALEGASATVSVGATIVEAVGISWNSHGAPEPSGSGGGGLELIAGAIATGGKPGQVFGVETSPWVEFSGAGGGGPAIRSQPARVEVLQPPGQPGAVSVRLPIDAPGRGLRGDWVGASSTVINFN
jgi:hypothetical protein